MRGVGDIGDALSIRSRMNITLYGSYQPPLEKRFLARQRDFLRDNGYVRARLVSDDPATGIDPLTASKRHLLQSDVNFMFFTTKGMRHGVVRELAYVAEDPSMVDKIGDCVVFDEVDDAESSIPELSWSDISNRRIEVHRFENEQILHVALLARAEMFVIRKGACIQTRPSV